MLAKDGLPGVLEAMRYSRSDLIEQFLRIYDKQPDRLKAILPWEAWCIKGDIPIPQLLGEIILSLREHSVNAIKILAITHHPDSVQTRIHQSKTPMGYRERQALDVALGFLPTPRGPTFIERYYGPGSLPQAELPAKPAGALPAGSGSTSEEPPVVTAPVVVVEPEEPKDPEDIEIENLFPDASRTARILND